MPAGTPNQPSARPTSRHVQRPMRMATASKARSSMSASTLSTKGAYRRRTPSASVMRMAPAMISAQVRPMTTGARSMARIQSERVVVGLEDELVALLEQDAERGRAEQLEEREATASQREARRRRRRRSSRRARARRTAGSCAPIVASFRARGRGRSGVRRSSRRRIGRMTTEVRAPSVPIYLAGEFVEAGTPLEVRNPATDEVVATTFQAGPAELERAIAAAVEAFEQTRRLASYERRDALAHVAACIERDADELATLLTRESGKPIRDARGEVARGGAHVPHRGRGGAAHQRGVAAARLGAGEPGPARDRAALPDRSGGGHQPLQLPAQPGRAQGRAGDRGRLQHRPQAAVEGPAGDAAHRRLPRRDRPAEGRGQHPADGSAHRRPDGRRRSIQAPLASPARRASAGR